MTAIPSMTTVAPTVAAMLGLPAPAQATDAPLAEILADIPRARAVAIVAPDALGMHPFNLWRHEMPYLLSLHNTRHLELRAVMPTITPVNFATMITGAEMAVHGIKSFNDSFACETLFDLVRSEGGCSVGVGQKGYTGSELLGRHADYRGTAESNTDAEVEEIAMALTREHRPRFLIVQLGSTDTVMHRHGPSSPEVAPMMRETDGRLERMCGELQSLGYAIIVNADHGQHDADGRGSHGLEIDEDAIVPCTWLGPA